MTETDMWSMMKNWLPGYAVRLENVISFGMPDVIWCPSGLAVFLELKVIQGFHIYIRNSQMVFGHVRAKSIPVNQHLFVVGGMVADTFMCYNYNTINKLPHKLTGKDKIKVNLDGIKPDFIWRGNSNVCDYVKQLEKETRDGWSNRTSD